jgi:predicted lipoprotein with Yx(FWY)xxD motif
VLSEAGIERKSFPERIVMSLLRPQPALAFRASLLTGVASAALAAACLNDSPAGLTDPAAGQTGAGTSSSAQGGKAATGGTATGEGAADGIDEGGSGGTTAGTSSAAGSAPTPGEGGSGPGEGGMGGSMSDPDDGVHIGRACTFHTDAPAPSDDGAAGAGGEGPAPDVVAQVSPFVGAYLTDAAGRTLYTYGADFPGDCQHLPVSNCTADCLVSWPVFDAGDRVLGPGVSDAGFGSIERAEGGFQTTYMGWPLYYYKTDLTLGQLTGQGKGKLWHVAEVSLPSVVIMKSGMLKYLADADGHTLYVSAADQVGSAEADPVSNCQGDCREVFEGFHEKSLSVVTSLESSDFQVFVRSAAGGLQLAYKGMPLYRAATDLKSGDMNGMAITGFSAAVP